MQNNSKSQDLSIQQAMQLAKTPAGQQLIAHLQSQGRGQFQEAMTRAAAGDYTQAKALITAMLATPEAKQLLEQLGRK